MANSILLSDEKELNVDSILKVVGEFGRYQIALHVLCFIIFIPILIPMQQIYFIGYNPPWKCASNSSVCHLNGTYLPSSQHYLKRCDMERTDWEYTQPKYYSIVTEFDLSCGKEIYIFLATTVFFIGFSMGAVITGKLADKFGRKTIAFPCIFFSFTLSVASALSNGIWMFIVCRFFLGFATPGVFMQCVIIMCELTSPKLKPLVNGLVSCYLGLAFAMLGIKASLIQEWRMLIYVCCLPYVFSLGFYWIFPESIRWLHVVGKDKEAMSVLTTIAKINKQPLGNIKLTKISEKGTAEVAKLSEIFWPLQTLKKTKIQMFGWFICMVVFYGISLSVDDLAGSKYRDYIMSSLLQIPAGIVCIYACARLGRKFGTIPPFYFTGFVLICIAMVPESSGLKTIRVFLGMNGKLFISVALASIYTWSLELNPTSTRSLSMGLMQLSARTGAGCAPWVAKALQVYNPNAPFILMGSLSVLVGMLLHWLPETKGLPTAEVHDTNAQDIKMVHIERTESV